MGPSSARKRGRASTESGARKSAPAPPWAAFAERASAPLWLIATAALLWSLMFRFLFNSDLWFHLAAGREIWRGRAIPAADTWSYTAAGRPWHNHEWLADLLYYGWSRAFGIESLVYWQWLVVGGAYLILYRLLARLSGSRPAASLLTVLALAVGVPFFDIRPNLWSVLGFVVLISLTLGRERPPVWLPLLFVVWVNLHGGVMLGLMALPILLAGQLAAGGIRLRRAVALWLACIVAACINPYGWTVFSFVFKLATSSGTPSRTTLYEWLPPWVPGGIEAPLFPWAVALGVASALPLLRPALRSPRDGAALASLGLALLTLAMSLQSRRFIPFFAIAQSLLAAQAAGRLFRARTATPRRLAASAALAVALLGVAVWRLAPYPLTSRAFDPLSWASQMPVESVSFLEANGIAGNLFAYHLWGGYIEHRAAGRLKVHYDPRAETVFDPEIARQHFRVLEGKPGWQDELARTGAGLVLWPMYEARERAMGEELSRSPRWQPLYRDGVSLLLARRGFPLPQPLRETPDSAYRSWARGRQAMDERRYADA
ncbi:MAG TPA: hypothetical protein VG477_03950, partial [Thermoanaerobaculia bacterium]|nr:hypothetical protein [Thermoanaerobaculia bacterium]